MMVPNLTSTGTGTVTPGPRGYSAYQIAQQEGFTGSAADWVASLEGDNGESVYEIAQRNGFTGTEAEFITSLAGEPGQSVELRKTETSIQSRQVPDGAWADLVQLADLKGEPGIPGGGGEPYDDTVIVQRVEAVETAVASKAADSDLDTQTARIDGIVGTDGQGGRLKTVEQDVANSPRYDFEGSISAHYVYAGIMSDDGSGNYVSNGGGIIIGGATGVRYRHEGFYAHNDEGSIASYPQVANRANRLALCPSGDPQNIVGEDTASLALQHLNGSYEQRFVLVSKKAGEYRIASVATGVGTNFPITVAPGNYRTTRFEVNGTTTFTAEPINGGAVQNTVVSVKNPAATQYMRLFGRTNGQFGIEYVSGSGNLDYRFNQVGLALGGIDATRRFTAQITEQSVGAFFASCTSLSYTGLAAQIDVARTAGTDFSFFFARSNSLATPDIEFNLRGDGSGFADGAWNANGADYCEYFEWFDGNQTAEDRVGRSVVLVGDKIRLALDGEEPFGVISALPSVVGNAAWNSWTGKYRTDDFGRVVKDSDGNPILNPDFDPALEYKPREDRPEWSPVGLTGRLRLYKGQPTGSRWIRLTDVSDAVEEWLVR